MSMDNDTSSMSMDHDHGDHTGTSMMDHHTPAPSTAMADMSGMSDMTADPFCNGDGAVMLMGFQVSHPLCSPFARRASLQ